MKLKEGRARESCGQRGKGGVVTFDRVQVTDTFV